MRCREVQHALCRQLDDDLSAAGQERLFHHLSVCTRCRRAGELLALGRRLCADSRRERKPPADFIATVMRSVRNEKAARSTFWAQLCTMAERLLPAFAMLVILFIGIFFVLRRVPDARLGLHDPRELFVPMEEEPLLIADQRNITADRVIRTVLEGK